MDGNIWYLSLEEMARQSDRFAFPLPVLNSLNDQINLGSWSSPKRHETNHRAFIPSVSEMRIVEQAGILGLNNVHASGISQCRL